MSWADLTFRLYNKMGDLLRPGMVNCQHATCKRVKSHCTHILLVTVRYPDACRETEMEPWFTNKAVSRAADH